MAFATSADFQLRYDATVSGLLTRDDGTGTIQTGVISAILADASEMVESALFQGGRYTASELSTASTNLLKRLTCDIAIHLLYARRGRAMPDAIQQRYDDAENMLGLLRRGERVLESSAAINATKTTVYRPAFDVRRNNFPMTNSQRYPSTDYGTAGGLENG